MAKRLLVIVPYETAHGTMSQYRMGVKFVAKTNSA